MTVDEIMASASAERVTLALEGDDVVVDWNGEPPSGALIDAIRNAKPEIIARLQMERRQVNRWVANKLTDWPQESFLHCRRRLVAGQAFIDVTNGEARARFHRECHPLWLTGQEALARKTIGLGQ